MCVALTFHQGASAAVDPSPNAGHMLPPPEASCTCVLFLQPASNVCMHVCGVCMFHQVAPAVDGYVYMEYVVTVPKRPVPVTRCSVSVLMCNYIHTGVVCAFHQVASAAVDAPPSTGRTMPPPEARCMCVLFLQLADHVCMYVCMRVRTYV